MKAMTKALAAASLASSSLLSLMALAVDEPLLIAERGRSAEYAIVIPVDASVSVRYAADELGRYVKRMTGVGLPVASSGEGAAIVPSMNNTLVAIRNVAAFVVAPTVGCIAGAWVGSRVHPMKSSKR